VADLADTAGLRLQGGQFGSGIKFHLCSGLGVRTSVAVTLTVTAACADRPRSNLLWFSPDCSRLITSLKPGNGLT
ncbi:hypothetical protein ACDI65_26555, partial [Klebsiella pneumoniae]|uniref:hypothetical protein n=1 Tax=Klebsiella pneumoniae TaxID=573 RepID=UPI00353184AE